MRWRRAAIGVVLTLHGLAHSNVIVWATDAAPFWLVSLLWMTATIGYVGAGLGVLGMPVARSTWPWLMAAATLASLILLALAATPLASLGILLDLLLVPGAVRWGPDAIEGQRRHEDRIRPEWQHRQAGDFVRATQPTYLGGRLGDVGWRVTSLLPGRAFVLENWGAFVLQPVDSTTTRFLVRTRGEGEATPWSMLLGPINIFVFEPAHFIMQRRMMLGIRDRAERMMRS